MKTVETTMSLSRSCKHSVVFEAKKGDVFQSVYLMNKAYEELGKPAVITITVSAK